MAASKALERTTFDLAGEQQEIELAQGGSAIGRFEIVVGAEQALAAGLALALGDGAQRVEPAGDGRQEALLGLHVGGNRPEQRRLGLVGAVAAPQALDGGIGLPAGLQQVVDAQPLVPGAKVGVVGAAGAAGIAEHQDALVVIHEGLRLGEIGRARTVLDAEPLTLAHDPPRSARHLGDHVGAEALHDLVERPLDRSERGQPLDQAVAALDGIAALHGLAVAIDRPRGEVAVAIGEGLEELCREAVRQVVEHVLARRDIDLDVAPFLGRDVGKPPLHQRLAGGDDLDDGGMAGIEVALDRRDQRRRLHRGDQVREEPLLGGFEGRPCCRTWPAR